MGPSLILGKHPGRSSSPSWTPQYQAVYDAMPTKPVGMDKTAQMRLMYRLVKSGVYAKSEVIDVFAVPTEDVAYLNWKNPGVFNATPVNTPLFSAYQGVLAHDALVEYGWVRGYVKSNFIPSVNGTLVSQNSMTFLMGIGDDVVNSQITGGYSVIDGVDSFIEDNVKTDANGSSYFVINSTQGADNGITTFIRSSKKHIGITRSGASFDLFVNYAKHANTGSVSNKFFDKEIGFNAFNNNGSFGSIDYTRRRRYALISSALSDDEIRLTVDAFEEYLDAIGVGLISGTKFNLAFEGHSFMTNGGNTSKVSNQIALNSNCVKNTNLSIAGCGMNELNARAAALDASLSSIYKNILVVWVGVNDISNVAGQGSTQYNIQKTYYQNRLNAGWDEILVYTCTPTDNGGRNAVFETERNVFNNLLRNDLSLINGIHILDTDTIANLTDYTNATYFNVDHLHLTYNGGDPLAATLAINKINEII